MTAHHHYQSRDGVVVALTTAERDRFFDNRDPGEWVHIRDVMPARTLPEFVTDELEDRA